MARRNSIDQETLQDLNSNDIKALEIVFLYYYAGLVIYSEGITGNRQASEEIVSDTFFKLNQLQPKNFEHEKQLTAWLRTTVYRASIDDLRKNKFRRNFRDPELLAEEEFRFDQSVEWDPVFIQYIIEAIEQLPPKSKLVFHYKIIGGLTTKEIAELLHISISGVQNLKCYAIKNIKEYLRGRGKWPLGPDC